MAYLLSRRHHPTAAQRGTMTIASLNDGMGGNVSEGSRHHNNDHGQRPGKARSPGRVETARSNAPWSQKAVTEDGARPSAAAKRRQQEEWCGQAG